MKSVFFIGLAAATMSMVGCNGQQPSDGTNESTYESQSAKRQDSCREATTVPLQFDSETTKKVFYINTANQDWDAAIAFTDASQGLDPGATVSLRVDALVYPCNVVNEGCVADLTQEPLFSNWEDQFEQQSTNNSNKSRTKPSLSVPAGLVLQYPHISGAKLIEDLLSKTNMVRITVEVTQQAAPIEMVLTTECSQPAG